MPNFHYRVERAPGSEKLRASRGVGRSGRCGGKSKMVSNRRCNRSLFERRTRRTWTRTPLSFPPASSNAESHGIKPSPGRVLFPPLYAVAASGSSAPSGPVRLSRRTFSPAESMGVRPVSQPRTPPPPSTGRLAVPDRHLEQTPSASTTERPGLRVSWIFYLLAIPLLPLRLLEFRCAAFLSISSSCMLLFPRLGSAWASTFFFRSGSNSGSLYFRSPYSFYPSSSHRPPRYRLSFYP